MGELLVYFYPHGYLRDRQLDTIRHWPKDQVLNPELVDGKSGGQVSRDRSLARSLSLSWKQRLPMVNVKRRPKRLPAEAVVYTWGAVLASGPFIVDLDNPYALTGYNLWAMTLYRGVLRHILAGPRCREIRCLSEACRETLRLIFGEEVYRRARVHYPYIRQMVHDIPEEKGSGGCSFLFVGTQFEIKGGPALLRAFRRVYEVEPTAQLDLVTHLPAEYVALAHGCPGIAVHEARFSRDEIFQRFMRNADVLVHPTYVESFGMVVLEAMAHGLAVVATDVYALREMVHEDVNGVLLEPPISIWDGYLPSQHYYGLPRFNDLLRQVDTSLFEERLAQAMLRIARNPQYRLRLRRGSLDILGRVFARMETVNE